MELLHTAHGPAGDGPFPTIVALHGWGASAHDLLGFSQGGAMAYEWALSEPGRSPA